MNERLWGSSLALLQAFHPYAKAFGLEKPEEAETIPQRLLSCVIGATGMCLPDRHSHGLVSLSPPPSWAAKLQDLWLTKFGSVSLSTCQLFLT